jgi:hypothetical protein
MVPVCARGDVLSRLGFTPRNTEPMRDLGSVNSVTKDPAHVASLARELECSLVSVARHHVTVLQRQLACDERAWPDVVEMVATLPRVNAID